MDKAYLSQNEVMALEVGTPVTVELRDGEILTGVIHQWLGLTGLDTGEPQMLLLAGCGDRPDDIKVWLNNGE